MRVELLGVDGDSQSAVVVLSDLEQDGAVAQCGELVVEDDPALFPIRVGHDHVFLLLSALVRKHFSQKLVLLALAHFAFAYRHLLRRGRVENSPVLWQDLLYLESQDVETRLELQVISHVAGVPLEVVAHHVLELEIVER